MDKVKVGSFCKMGGQYIIFSEYAATNDAYGTFFKDTEVYENDWGAPCYAEEACFDDLAVTDCYWTHASLLSRCAYNERLCDAMFAELAWQCPDTWLDQLDEDDYAQFWSWLKVGCKAFIWLDEWRADSLYEVTKIEDSPENYSQDTGVWLCKSDKGDFGEREEVRVRLWELAETDVFRQLQQGKGIFYNK